MGEPELELGECAGCRKLGQCCYFSVQLPGSGVSLFSAIPCPHLDQRTGTCVRYETRHEVRWCMRVGELASWPNFCPHSSRDAFSVTVEEFRQHLPNLAPDGLQEEVDRMVVANLIEMFGADPRSPEFPSE